MTMKDDRNSTNIDTVANVHTVEDSNGAGATPTTSSTPKDWQQRLLERFQSMSLDVSHVDDLDQLPITLPQLQYGYAQQPMEWPELVQLIQVENDLARLSRSEQQQREYQLFRYLLKEQYVSIVDHLMITKFGWERTKGQDGRWVATKPATLSNISTTTSTSNQLVLVPNDFPYYMSKNIVHYVLWKTPQDITMEEIDQAKAQLTEQLAGGGAKKETLHWINPPHLKSLPEIDHVHILCRLQE